MVPWWVRPTSPFLRYAVYHRKEGLQKIAQRVHGLAQLFASEAQKAGLCVSSTAAFFDTAGTPGELRGGRWAGGTGWNVRDGEMGLWGEGMTMRWDILGSWMKLEGNDS